MRFYGAFGVCGGCVAGVTWCVFMAVYTILHIYVVLNAFRSFMLYLSTRLNLRRNKDFSNTGLMFQLRFDNFGAISLLYFLLGRCAS